MCDEPAAVASCCVGAVTWKAADAAPTWAVNCSTLCWNALIDHGCTSPRSTGMNHAYERKNVPSSPFRDRPATPFAITTGEGCGVW